MRLQGLIFGLALTASVIAIVACGGGGGSSSPGGGVVPTPTSEATQSLTTVSGTVVQIPSDAYGPVTMGSAIYASSDATQTAAVAGATVVIGPVPITGATAPATLPTGDVAATTTSTGAFNATIVTVPVVASSAEPFVIPQNNILGIMPPATGFYVEVFGVGTDGKSAGALIPLHRFVFATGSIALRVSTTNAAEAGALTTVNNGRSINSAGTLIFDEDAEEAARLHASDMASAGFACHYDTHNIGPSSRYLAVGGMGLVGESVADDLAGDPITAFSIADAGFMAENTQSPPGGHFENNVDSAHLWAGLAAVPSVIYGGNYLVDYELVTPNAQDSIAGSSGYTNNGCASGITINNS